MRDPTNSAGSQSELLANVTLFGEKKIKVDKEKKRRESDQMLAEINKNTTAFIRELDGKMNWTVSWLLGILYLQVFSLNLRTCTVRIFYINLLSSAG